MQKKIELSARGFGGVSVEVDVSVKAGNIHLNIIEKGTHISGAAELRYINAVPSKSEAVAIARALLLAFHKATKP